jgi:hypothetical protein
MGERNLTAKKLLRACRPDLCAAALLLLLSTVSARSAEQLREYSNPDYGFTAAFPSVPVMTSSGAPTGDGSVTTFKSLNSETIHQFSVFVGRPREHGIFDASSVDAFLNAFVDSLTVPMTDAKVQSSRRITYVGMPAIEYAISFRIEDVPMIARGIAFVVDGGHMRVSMLYPRVDTGAQETYGEFRNSFKLIPIRYQSGRTSTADQRGISFQPPLGWVQDALGSPLEVARYHNLTRSMVLRSAGSSAYTCASFASELKRSGRVTEVSKTSISGRQFTKILSYEDVPQYNVRLTNVEYCIDSRTGAISLGASEEQAMYWRWAAVFEGAAGSIRGP